jgi:hypothetical protein
VPTCNNQPGEQAMMESDDVSFRSHVQSTDKGVSIVFDTNMPMLHDGVFSFRLKEGISPDQVHGLVAQLRDHVEKIEFHLVYKPVFEKV